MLFELVRALALRARSKVGLLVAWNVEPRELTDAERDGYDALRAVGVEVLPELVLKPPKRRPMVARILSPALADLHPETACSDSIIRHIAEFEPEVIVPIWSEWLTAVMAAAPVDKFAYYGNPDLKSALARANFLWDAGAIGIKDYARARFLVARLEDVHLDAMRRYRWLGNVAANDAEYYRRHGHRGAFYIQNTWHGRLGESWRERREALESSAGNVVVGSLGKQDGTANSMGLHFLGESVLPELARLAGADVRVRIYGAGTPPSFVSRALAHPIVEMRGFVDDIDEEIMAAKVFLCVNNATNYKVGHTRYLHAWSLGACVVAHRDASLSMPEIEHGRNALLGRDGAEIAALTLEALGNDKLRKRIAEGGYDTYRREFNPDVVASRILECFDAKAE